MKYQYQVVTKRSHSHIIYTRGKISFLLLSCLLNQVSDRWGVSGHRLSKTKGTTHWWYHYRE
jgi:hypothetical protein